MRGWKCMLGGGGLKWLFLGPVPEKFCFKATKMIWLLSDI